MGKRLWLGDTTGDILPATKVMQDKPRWILPASWAARIVIALWLPYTLLNLFFPGPALTYALGLVIALLALISLKLAHVPAIGIYPHIPSRESVVALAILTLFIPFALLIGRGQPWDWLGNIVYAPASALGQELYFRSALLTACGTHGSRRAILLQATLFALWHARAFRVVPAWEALLVLLGTFVAGVVWGWQVRRDDTTFYAFIQHLLFLIVQ
jgi:membrane protease YdiL (CAAX protease family)